MHIADLTGQSLFRLALREDSLDVFNRTAAIMRDPRESERNRADVFKAIRYGLVALAIDGWQQAITGRLDEPVCAEDTAITHTFAAEQLLYPHNYTLIDKRRPGDSKPHVAITQGEFALGVLGWRLQTSMQEYVAIAANNRVRSIAINDIMETIVKYVLEAKQLGLTAIPDYYDNGKPVFEDFFGTRTSNVDNADPEEQEMRDPREALTVVAYNPIRFSSLAIQAVIRHYANVYTDDLHPDYRPMPSDAILESVRQANRDKQPEIIALLARTMSHIAHAARQVRSRGLPNEDRSDGFPDSSVQLNRRSQLELTWPDKRQRPLRRLGENEPPPIDEDVHTRPRYGCPFTYTKSPKDPIMPADRVYDAMLIHMIRNGLTDPAAFMSPKKLYSAQAS